MDKKKARAFLEELQALQEKYDLYLSAGYEEELDYDYGGESYISGGQSYLLLSDKEGFEVSLDDLENGLFYCAYCGRRVEGDADFCNVGCETKEKERRAKE